MRKYQDDYFYRKIHGGNLETIFHISSLSMVQSLCLEKENSIYVEAKTAT